MEVFIGLAQWRLLAISIRESWERKPDWEVLQSEWENEVEIARVDNPLKMFYFEEEL